MKLTNRQIIDILNALFKISEQDLPVALTYKVFDINQKLNEKYQTYIKSLEAIMKKNNVESPDDPVIRDQAEELLGIEINIEIEKLKKEEILNSGVKLSLAQLTFLSPIIEG